MVRNKMNISFIIINLITLTAIWFVYDPEEYVPIQLQNILKNLLWKVYL